jgi:hypothetical protein
MISKYRYITDLRCVPEKGYREKLKFSHRLHVGVLTSLWLFLFPIFLFAAQPKGFFLGGLKKLEQRSHKRVELSGDMYSKHIFFNPVAFSL